MKQNTAAGDCSFFESCERRDTKRRDRLYFNEIGIASLLKMWVLPFFLSTESFYYTRSSHLHIFFFYLLLLLHHHQLWKEFFFFQRYENLFKEHKKENSLVNFTFTSVKKGSLFIHILLNRIQFTAITIDARDNIFHSFILAYKHNMWMSNGWVDRSIKIFSVCTY